MKKRACCEECKMILEEETVAFGGMLLHYQLLVCNGERGRFHIRVASGDEHTEAALGNRVSDAIKLYHSIVRGRVTPCGLSDVVSDFCM
ncbi:MAG: hypothetical protein IKC59_06185 [Clostridia bacterium]|nr:hypothetical protein [Clostridia bacterium]